jgi:hypothetical protein
LAQLDSLLEKGSSKMGSKIFDENGPPDQNYPGFPTSQIDFLKVHHGLSWPGK